ncbi:hypothetical protein MGU_11288 [Metarhizium guizhouense ARSEF 977]|uniref:Uncharacterized protein n=1 Tax=Metarhizium guizhouense (strain ARSEF 977) TaxID=1276136 RepID=A0A0B4G436_METGA|nr:hypothetical protein MGU_11288 [Metarhizium guizhouense ARSEF 977]
MIVIHLQDRAVPKSDSPTDNRLAPETKTPGKNKIPAGGKEMTSCANCETIAVRHRFLVLGQRINGSREETPGLQEQRVVVDSPPGHSREIQHHACARSPIEVAMATTFNRQRDSSV